MERADVELRRCSASVGCIREHSFRLRRSSKVHSEHHQHRHRLAEHRMRGAMSSTSHSRILSWALLVLAAGPLYCLAALFPKGSAVAQLSSYNFRKEILEIEKPAIVAFTAPWCGHCKNLAPEFDKAAKSLDGIVKFANMDCDAEENKGICGNFDVKGFPTILQFPPTKKRIPKPYQGERSAKALVEYASQSLPHLAKKLNADELQKWVVGSNNTKTPSVAKVLLLSDKPTSSALYKSLALDFRRSMSFGFARGDQAAIQSVARLNLGIHITSKDDLPMLLVYPPREAGEAFEKGKFRTYEGKLKYGPIKAWLDGLKNEYKLQDQDISSPSSKTAKKAKTAKASASHSPEDPLPPGGFHEWKAVKKDSQRKAQEPVIVEPDVVDEAEKPSAAEAAATSRESRASSPPTEDRMKAKVEKLAEQFQAQQKAKTAGEPKEPEESVSEPSGTEAESAPPPVSADSVEQEEPVDEEDMLDSPDMAEAKASARVASDAAAAAAGGSGGAAQASATDAEAPRGYLYTDSQRADIDFMNSVLRESGAFDVADEAMKKVGEAASKVKSSAEETYENVAKAAGKVTEQLNDLLGKKPDSSNDPSYPSSADFEPFTRKRKALTSAFESWLAGESADWETDHSSDFAKATEEVEALIASDPKRAVELAWENERWLLKELQVDRNRMAGAGVLGKAKKAQLDEMIAVIKGRLADHEAGRLKSPLPPSDPLGKRAGGMFGSPKVHVHNTEESVEEARKEMERQMEEAIAAAKPPPRNPKKATEPPNVEEEGEPNVVEQQGGTEIHHDEL